VGVLLNVTLDLGTRNVQGRTQAAIALLAFTASLFKVNAVVIVVFALALGAWLIRPEISISKLAGAALSPQPVEPTSPKRWAGIAAVTLIILAVAALTWSIGSDVGVMGQSLFKIGTVAFGNGATIIPLIQSEVVDTHHWLTLNQFADGIALGQITPGPFLITATFIGYKMGGILGAALATFAIFSPSFAMTLVFTEVFAHLRNLRAVRGAMAGVMAAFVGLLIVVILQLGSIALNVPGAIALAGAAFIAVRFFKLDILWVFAGGLLLWGGLLALGLV
jgi:chromate transporter